MGIASCDPAVKIGLVQNLCENTVETDFRRGRQASGMGRSCPHLPTGLPQPWRHLTATTSRPWGHRRGNWSYAAVVVSQIQVHVTFPHMRIRSESEVS
jgi:hypothetical protein